MYAHEEFSSIPYEGPVSPVSAAFFPQSHDFVVSGGTFTSVTNIIQHPPSRPTNFRMIPLEEIDLREIRFDNESSIVDRLPGMRSVRRTYSARLHGRHPSVTVVLYNGDAARKEWAGEVSKYSRFRHPNLMQFYAASASSSGLYAIIFHDDLLPFVRGKQSHLWVMYILACFAAGVKDICYLFKYALPNRFMGMSCTLRIRSSTGRLCLDPSPDLADCEVVSSDALFDALNNLPVNQPWCTVSYFDPYPESKIFDLPLQATYMTYP